MSDVFYQRLSLAAVVLCFIVVTLGAYVRLSDAGLGCPDWPGCYGQLVGVPETQSEISLAEASFPERPVEAHKAWKEMVHRYAAGALGLMILALFVFSFFIKKVPRVSPVIPAMLCVLVLFQALLGMWTVTLLLKPFIVTAHLLGGMTILALLFWLYLQASRPVREQSLPAFSEREPRNEVEAMQSLRKTHAASVTEAEERHPRLKMLGMVVLVMLTCQIFLGAWTSSNYAALACPDFPTCQGSLWPETDFTEAFILWRGTGVNYEFGVLDSTPRATIHVVHRLGAIVVTAFSLVLLIGLLSLGKPWHKYAAALGLTLLLQVSIGIAIVLHQLPLPLAVAHNGGAALLLLALVAINERLWRQP